MHQVRFVCDVVADMHHGFECFVAEFLVHAAGFEQAVAFIEQSVNEMFAIQDESLSKLFQPFEEIHVALFRVYWHPTVLYKFTLDLVATVRPLLNLTLLVS